MFVSSSAGNFPASSTGQHCTEDVDECRLQPNTCQNGGTCHNGFGSYNCVCVNGWSGVDCSENLNDCAEASCSEGSTCIDRVASFICLCPRGKTGESKLLHHTQMLFEANKEVCPRKVGGVSSSCKTLFWWLS